MLNRAYSESELEKEDFLNFKSLYPDEDDGDEEEIPLHQLPKDSSKWKTRKLGYTTGCSFL